MISRERRVLIILANRKTDDNEPEKDVDKSDIAAAILKKGYGTDFVLGAKLARSTLERFAPLGRRPS